MKNTNTKNTTMKNMFNSAIAVIVAMALIFGTASCKKEDVNPSTQNNNNGGNNSAPTVVASFSSNVITISATDVDGSISKVEILDGSTVVSTLTSAPYTYSVGSLSAGNYSYTIKAYDNVNATSTTTVTFTITGGGSTNNAPTFTATSLKVTSNGTAQSFTLPVSDSDGNTVTITSISGASSNVNVTYTGLTVTVTPNNSVFAGAETLSITISDGTDNTTSNFTVNVGENAQIDTYNLMSPFFKSCQTVNIAGNVTLNQGNIVTTMTQPSGGFFNSTAGAGTYTYKILSNGNVEFTAGANKIEYTVSVASSMLTFTKISNNSTYSIY